MRSRGASRETCFKNSVELLDDVVALEEVAGQVIAPLTRPLTARERVRVRQDACCGRDGSSSGIARCRVGCPRTAIVAGGSPQRGR